MDEKEVIKDIRWDFSRGKSRAEITRRLQRKGFKLEFIDSLIDRARRPKRIVKGIFLSIVLLIFMWMGVYGMFFHHTTKLVEYSPNWVEHEESSSLQITPELISLVASEMGATKLRRNPFNLKKPILNFVISNQSFHTIIDKKIETYNGISSDADLSFSSDEVTLSRIFLSENLKDAMVKEISSGNINIEKIASDQELFLKGYLSLYDELGK